MHFAAQTSRMFLVLAAITWLLAGLTPDGLQVCLQSNGQFELGLDCSCTTCHAEDDSASCCTASGCSTGEHGLAGVPCCTHADVAAVPAGDISGAMQMARVDVLVANLQPTDRIFTAATLAAVDTYHRAHAPPGEWSPDTTRLLI